MFKLTTIYLFKPLLVLLLTVSFLCTQAQLSSAHKDHLRYIKLPAGISKSQLAKADKKLAKSLISHAIKQLRTSKPDTDHQSIDLIVEFIGQDNQPVHIQTEQTIGKLDFNSNRDANDLTYTFHSPDQPWRSDELSELNSYVNDFYPVIKKITGGPFFSNQVNIRKDSTINYAGLYFPALNEMVLHHPAADVFCHESIHAFRDDFVMTISTFEEGITRATEIEVFNQLEAYIHPFDENHSYAYDYYYEAMNRPALAAPQGSIYLSPALQFLRYQVGSYIWAKAFIEDSLFFRRFNDSLYARMLLDPGVPPQEPALKAMFIKTKPLMEGLPTAFWYEKQYLLSPTPDLGFHLFPRVNEYAINCFNRLSSGYEEPQAGVAISWELLNYFDEQVDNGSAAADALGTIIIPNSILSGYNGNVKIITSVQTPLGLLKDTISRAVFTGGEEGVFGVVEGVASGSISITPLDTAIATKTAAVVNGAFVFPNLENVRGRFRVNFVYGDCKNVSRIFTKDRSKYFLSVSRSTGTYWTGAADSSWHNPLNWSSGAVPAECADVVILPGAPHGCIIDAPAICRSLKLENGAVLVARHGVVIRL